jgi:hypothetical protein
MMRVLRRKEILTELERLGISDTSEINAYIKEYKAYNDIKIKSLSISSPKLLRKTTKQISKSRCAHLSGVSDVDIYFPLTQRFPGLFKSQCVQKDKK